MERRPITHHQQVFQNLKQPYSALIRRSDPTFYNDTATSQSNMYTSTIFSASMLAFAGLAAAGPVDLSKRQTLIGCHAGGVGLENGCSDPAKPYCSCVTYTPCFTSLSCVGVYSYTCDDADICPGSYKVCNRLACSPFKALARPPQYKTDTLSWLKRDIADAQELATRHALALENTAIPAE